MKILAFFSAACLFAVSAMGQGTILFNNRTPSGDAPVSLSPWASGGAGSMPGFTAQLFLVNPGGELTPLFPATTFRTGSPAAEFFIEPVSVTVPGIPAGSPATVRMRAWIGPTYGSNSPWYGESPDVMIPQLGGMPPDGGPPIPDALLLGLQGFAMVLPEPSAITLGLVGAAGFLLCRGKRRSRREQTDGINTNPAGQ